MFTFCCINILPMFLPVFYRNQEAGFECGGMSSGKYFYICKLVLVIKLFHGFRAEGRRVRRRLDNVAGE